MAESTDENFKLQQTTVAEDFNKLFCILHSNWLLLQSPNEQQ